jgi:hypothetical protein
MNMPRRHLDCWQDEKDDWLCMTLKYLNIPCESRVPRVLIPCLLGAAYFVAVLVSVMAFVLLPKISSKLKVILYFTLTLSYLLIGCMLLMFWMLDENFISRSTGHLTTPFFALCFIVYVVTAIVHFLSMEELLSSLMILGKKSKEANIGLESMTSPQAKKFQQMAALVASVQANIRTISWIDSFMLRGAAIFHIIQVLLGLIMLPVAPAAIIPWYELPVGSSYFQKDFIIALVVLVIVIITLFLTGTAVATMWKIRRIVDQGIKSQDILRDLQTVNSDLNFKARLVAFRRKLDANCILAVVASMFGAFGADIVISMDYILGFRWWMIVLILPAMLCLWWFICTMIFPTEELLRYHIATVFLRENR